MSDRPDTGPAAPSDVPFGPDWELVGTGESPATVWRHPAGGRYAKTASGTAAADVSAERDRLLWLATRGFPCAEVLDWTETEDHVCLVTREVPGVPANELDPENLRAAWPAMAGLLLRLHEIPIRTCPYERRLAAVFERATAVVVADRVHTAFLPVPDQATPPADLLDRLRRQLEQRSAQEAADLVVCHGDACLPNFIVDPETSACTGMVDVGRLGVADRHVDLALLVENARSRWPSPARADQAFAVLAKSHGRIDPDRLRFYRDLDPLTWD